ncbi:MAG: hypothetical protein AWU57_486 [Marinobacter sp. T13-3]|nr:MAG: hypothetical protein AWU57_486 [Marinobacter sp. T13-3]
MAKRPPAQTLEAAATALSAEAESLKEAHTTDSGDWFGSSEVHKEYRHLGQLARELRQLQAEHYPSTEQNSDKPPCHWWSISFNGRNRETGIPCDGCAYIGFPDDRLSIARIKRAKQAAGVTDDAVMIAATYMGYMTRAELDQG